MTYQSIKNLRILILLFLFVLFNIFKFSAKDNPATRLKYKSNRGHTIFDLDATINGQGFYDDMNHFIYDINNHDNAILKVDQEYNFGFNLYLASKSQSQKNDVLFFCYITNLIVKNSDNKIIGNKPPLNYDQFRGVSFNSNYYSQNAFKFKFDKPGLYKISFTVVCDDSHINFNNHTYDYNIEVKSGPIVSISPAVSICPGEQVNLSVSPNNKNFEYKWYTDYPNILVPNVSNSLKLTPTSSTTFYVDVKDKTTLLSSLVSVSVTVKNEPDDPPSPQQENTCGVIKLSNIDNGSSSIWHSYFDKHNEINIFNKIIKTGYVNKNADIYYANTCSAVLNKENKNTFNYTQSGTSTIFSRAFDRVTGCWSDNCIPITLTLDATMPDALSFSNTTACLCYFDDVTLQVNTGRNTSSVNWYNDKNEKIGTGVTINVPRVERTYYVSAYNDVSKCETPITPIEVITTPCETCTGEFSPLPGNKYVLSAWVKEANSTSVTNYQNANISISYVGSSQISGPFYSKGPMIEGWQKIEETFTIPLDASFMDINLNNNPINLLNGDVFYDDIRIHPFDANMKSFVYDPVTLKLVAELDPNNFATYYSYDAEGNLTAVRKETTDGIKTIKENKTILNR